jgi:hypothetical protein
MLGRENATYETADVLTYVLREAYDAILLREVIYYLPVAKISGFLRRLSAFLTPNGVILIQVWASENTPGLVAAIQGGGLPVMQDKNSEVDPDMLRSTCWADETATPRSRPAHSGERSA